MIENVKVFYGFSVGKVSFNQLIHRVSLVAKSYNADYDIQIKSNRITISFYPFKHSTAKDISETNGAEILRSLIYLCDKFIDDGCLLSVDMSTALPF